MQYVPASVSCALERADEAVDRLLESGRRPGDVLVLTVGDPHPWQQHELSFGERCYWAQLTEGEDVFYADAAFARPARREVVVLVVNDGSADRAAKAFEKALGHAGALLVVCGESELVGAPGAPQSRPALARPASARPAPPGVGLAGVGRLCRRTGSAGAPALPACRDRRRTGAR